MQDEVEILTSLAHVSLLECLNKDPTLRAIIRRHCENRQGLSPPGEVNALIEQCHHSNLLIVALHLNLEEPWVLRARQWLQIPLIFDLVLLLFHIVLRLLIQFLIHLHLFALLTPLSPRLLGPGLLLHLKELLFVETLVSPSHLLLCVLLGTHLSF